MKVLLIAGTDTNVGKTYVTALIARDLVSAGVNVGVYKPICSGGVTSPDGELLFEDVETLHRALQSRFPRERICPQCFAAAAAPPVAARREGRTVDTDLLLSGFEWWKSQVDILLIEGIGGLLCPLTESETVADFAKKLTLPVLVVGRLGLGTINHTLLTIEAAAARDLTVVGIVLSDGDADAESAAVSLCARTNPNEIAARCDVAVLGVVPHGETRGLLQNGRVTTMDWLNIINQ